MKFTNMKAAYPCRYKIKEEGQDDRVVTLYDECYITIDVLNEAENSPLHLTRYFYGGDRYAKE